MELTVFGLALVVAAASAGHTSHPYKSHTYKGTRANSVSHSRPASTAPIPRAPHADANQELTRLQLEQNKIAHSNGPRPAKPASAVPPAQRESSSERMPAVNFHSHAPKNSNHPVGYASKHPNYRMQ